MNQFSNEWEIQYSAGNHMSIWPWSDVVSLVNRYKGLMPKPVNVLEIGVGAGANVPFLVEFANKWGGGYYGIDGSLTAIEMLKKRFKDCSFEVGDFTQFVPWEMCFSIIIDRASLTCNSTSAIKHSISLLKNHLHIGGLYFGFDWFSIKHSGFKYGNNIEDKFSKISENQGYFKGLGITHFSDEKHIKALWSNGFEFLHLEEKTTTRLLPVNEQEEFFGSFNFVVKKIF